MKNKISRAVINRLPKYYRHLQKARDRGIERISSKELSELLKSTASQVRQDFNNFGGFGQQGYGYNVKELLCQMERIMGVGAPYSTIIVGSGNLGQALAGYKGFAKNGFKLVAMFDRNPKLVGLKINDIDIQDAENLPLYLEQNDIDIAYRRHR